MDSPLYSQDVERCLAFIAKLSSHDVLKTSDAPTLAHLLSVAARVWMWGGSQNQAVAALLHDSLEDHEIDTSSLEHLFGKEVVEIVMECTDANMSDRRHLTWDQRKDAYLARLPFVSHEAALVIAADKLENAIALARDIRRDGMRVGENTTSGVYAVTTYYQAAAKLLAGRIPHISQIELQDGMDLLSSVIAEAELI